jgi:hypothetical protein
MCWDDWGGWLLKWRSHIAWYLLRVLLHFTRWISCTLVSANKIVFLALSWRNSNFNWDRRSRCGVWFCDHNLLVRLMRRWWWFVKGLNFEKFHKTLNRSELNIWFRSFVALWAGCLESYSLNPANHRLLFMISLIQRRPNKQKTSALAMSPEQFALRAQFRRAGLSNYFLFQPLWDDTDWSSGSLLSSWL